jgi:hypothetical protein
VQVHTDSAQPRMRIEGEIGKIELDSDYSGMRAVKDGFDEGHYGMSTLAEANKRQQVNSYLLPSAKIAGLHQ